MTYACKWDILHVPGGRISRPQSLISDEVTARLHKDTPAGNLLTFAMEGLPADLVPCIMARDNNVGEYAVPSPYGAVTAALA